MTAWTGCCGKSASSPYLGGQDGPVNGVSCCFFLDNSHYNVYISQCSLSVHLYSLVFKCVLFFLLQSRFNLSRMFDDVHA